MAQLAPQHDAEHQIDSGDARALARALVWRRVLIWSSILLMAGVFIVILRNL
jgi:hypothetical protein